MRKLLLLTSALVLTAMPALADSYKSPPAAGVTAAVPPGVEFTDGDKADIRNYFLANPTAPDKLSRETNAQIAQGKPLPLGVTKHPIPDGLQRQLQSYKGAEIVLVGGDVAMIDPKTTVVLDVMKDTLYHED